MPWVLLLALVVALNGWLLTGCLVPYLTAREPEYLLLVPSMSSLALWFVAALVALTTIHLVIARRLLGIGSWRDAFVWPAVRYLSPLLLLVVRPLAVVLLATPMSRAAGPWLYLSTDLYWWLVAVVVTMVLVELGALPFSVRSRWIFGVSLAIVLASSSLLASPRQRFQSVLVGDEPKYVRYLENWYRGRGMDVSNLGPIAELPAGTGNHAAGNFDGLGRALARVGKDLTNDARRLSGLPAPPAPGPASSQGGWFVDGKRGGVYQVHNPGISLLLLPGYLVDRALSHTQVWHPQFPTDLYATGGIVLLLYVAWGVIVFRLLRRSTADAALAWVVTAVVFLSLPVTAFAYQYYPEVAAGLIAAVLVHYNVWGDARSGTSAAAYGATAGFLPWLHLRFMPLTLGALVLFLIARPWTRGSLTAFIAGLALPLAVLAVYDYHVTGSLMPWALYALTPEGELFSAARVWHDFPALWLDRTWGLAGHAPIYLLALPGLWLLWRKHARAAVAVIYAVLVIAIPAAGHGYTGAFTTPSRLIAAVVPLLALPLAEAAATFASSRAFVASMALLGIISVQNGLTYNVHLIKSEASLHASTIGGWLFPLLLPDVQTPDRFTLPLAAMWVVVIVALLLLPAWFARRSGIATRSRSWTIVAATTAVAFATISAAVGTATSTRGRPEFTLNAGDARTRLVHAALTRHMPIQWSSTNGTVDVTRYFPNEDGTVAAVRVQPATPAAKAPTEVVLEVRRPGNRPGWGTALVDFGDGSPRVRQPVEDTARIEHVFAQAGDFHVSVEFDLWGLGPRTVVHRLRVSGR